MSGHQAWLEAPYTARANQELAYEAFLEAEDVNPDEYDAADLERMFEQWVEDSAADAAEARWEQDRDEDWERDFE